MKKLRANLHFVDNSVMEENASKLAKIQPVIDIFREQCLKVNPEECQSVDEQIIPAKTKFSGIRQYNPQNDTVFHPLCLSTKAFSCFSEIHVTKSEQ